MKNIYVILGLLWSVVSIGQVTLTSPSNSLEISGVLAADYNYRWLRNPGLVPDYQKNKPELATARLKFEGRSGRNYEYTFQVDLGALAFSTSPGEFPALLDANFVYRNRLVDLTMGYQKLPYSRFSLTPFSYQPYWQRPEISRGYMFSRRDVGITLSKEFWNDRIAVFGGAYSGMGEYIVTALTGGDGDANGKPEYTGRAEINYPYKIKYREVYETHDVQTPSVCLGFNGRYVERTKSFPYGTTDFDLLVVSGKKRTIGMDVAAQYRGFSGVFEIHQVQVTPADQADIDRFLLGKQTNYFRAGGLALQLAYYCKKWKSGVLVRYDELIPNDLRPNYTAKNLSFVYNYMLNGYKSMLRIQYWNRLNHDPLSAIPQKMKDNQVRIGWQFGF